MSDNCIALSDCVLAKKNSAARIAFHNKQYIHADDFYLSVSDWVAQLQAQPFQRYGLYTDDAYPFAVLLFALFHAGKEVWIVGNNRPGTALQLQQSSCELIGDWGGQQTFDYLLAKSDSTAHPLLPLNLSETRLIIFTSGSTGEPKPIAKSLSQFQLEIAVLEQQWGTQLGNAEVLSTVSHQHIYGLLFRVLWPLATGRCFHSSIYLNPEILVNNLNPGAAYWVASPAHLKRLDQNSSWQGIASLNAIFSSGGALPGYAAEQIAETCEQAVIEIYGSSETGGIAWKTQGKAWRLFPGLSVVDINGSWHLRSPYLLNNNLYPLDDQITLLDDGCFNLNGRSDRIVKIEEKRLSLTELEQRLLDLGLINEAYAMLLTKKREVIAVVIALSPTGLQLLSTQGRNYLIRQLRKELETWFESVVLPRKWLFVNTMPLTTQGKIDHTLLKGLLTDGGQKLPKLFSVNKLHDSVQLVMKIPQVQELIYFPDHFRGFPLLPGVVQLAWVEYFGKLFFDLSKPALFFSHLEVVKFIKTIQPDDELMLSLNWKADSGELCFNFSSSVGGCSSGRMVYKKNDSVSFVETQNLASLQN